MADDDTQLQDRSFTYRKTKKAVNECKIFDRDRYI